MNLLKRHRMRPQSYLSAILLALFALSLSVVVPSPAWAEIDQHASLKQLDALKQNIKAIDKWLDRANSEKSGLSKQLRKYELEIASISLTIKGLSAQNRQFNQELKVLKRQKQTQVQALNLQKAQLIKQLKTIYMEGQQPALKLLLDSDNPQDLSRYIKYFSYIKDARSEKIAAFQTALSKLDKTEQEILRKQTKLAENRAKLSDKKTALGKESKKRKQVLAKLESSIANKSGELQKLKEDQTRLEKLLLEVEQAIANLALPSDATPFKQQKRKLPWPLKGKVVERFGSRVAQGKLRSQGIRIRTPEDSAVQAVHYGRVVFSDWLRGFGLLLIIDHGDGYMSLYGNNKSLIKETGDWVAVGDTISYSGNSGGKSSSSLYFEIRRNGKPLNPTSWLRKSRG